MVILEVGLEHRSQSQMGVGRWRKNPIALWRWDLAEPGWGRGLDGTLRGQWAGLKAGPDLTEVPFAEKPGKRWELGTEEGSKQVLGLEVED